MTPHILTWIHAHAHYLDGIKSVFEHGSFNVNGSAREVLQTPEMEWIGADLSEGPGVDLVGESASILRSMDRKFDLIVACECFEHDQRFWETNAALKENLRPGGFYLVTTPSLGFPYHAYPRDYYRFTPDAYTDVFFAGMTILALDHVGEWPNVTVCGLARSWQ